MFNPLRTFAKDRRGAFAMQFALLAVPLCACTGLAVDGGRAFLARFELAAALDAAALAVGSNLDDDTDLDAVARKFVEVNFKTQHDNPIDLELVELGGEDDALVLRGSVAINTFFMPIIGQPYVTVAAESEVRRGGSNVEVALALDVTGSMNSTRIAGLKSASQILIDEVVSTQQTPFFSKVAIVPWAQSVNISKTGKDHVPASTRQELRGGDLRGSTRITNATWRESGTSTKSISTAGWRVGSAKTISGAAWQRSAPLATSVIEKFTQSGQPNKIRVTYAATGTGNRYTNGDFVRITGAENGFTHLNGNVYRVAERTSGSPYRFVLQELTSSDYVSPPSGSPTASTAGSSTRCWYSDCTVRITANSHGFSTGDRIFIENVSMTGAGSKEVNNTWGETWEITYRDSNNFSLDGTSAQDFKTYSSSSGKAHKCILSDCRYRVVTTSNHSFSSSDRLFFWGITESGTGTSLNTAAGTSVTVDAPSGDTFYLNGDSRNYKTWTSGGSVAECANASCLITMTSAGHGLSTGEKVEIRNIGSGMDGLNYCSSTCGTAKRYWTITKVSDDSYTLDGSRPSLDNVAGSFSGGSASSQCLSYGCSRIWYKDNTASYMASNCFVERPGANAYTDVAPSTSGLGIYYTSDGSCDTDNYVTPLTADKTRLGTAITDLSTGGSTAGQIGIAWAWSMLSPNFADVWDKETVNQPLAYGSENLLKVAVLMTDGEFNYQTCYGVQTSSASSTFLSQCDGKDSFAQAEEICENMKDAGITIYTVGLAINTSLYADDFLIKCASNPQYAHLASDEAALEVAFKKIAQSISRLRLSK